MWLHVLCVFTQYILYMRTYTHIVEKNSNKLKIIHTYICVVEDHYNEEYVLHIVNKLM